MPGRFTGMIVGRGIHALTPKTTRSTTNQTVGGLGISDGGPS